MPPTDDGASPAPVDRPLLEFIRDRLGSTEQFARAELTDPAEGLELRARLADGYYPHSVSEAVLAVRWYTNDDFTIHYRERHEDEDWECRWDRHPNPHNSRDHFHPPPDAATPGDDRAWPDDYRDMIQLVMADIEERIRTLWTT